jgi:CRP-like cAMP-binding protein
MAMHIILLKKKFTKGDLLFEEGAKGDEAYIIRHGYVTITKQDEDRTVELAIRGPGEIVGEMALIDEAPRSASLVAKTDVEVELITRKDLTGMFENVPEPVSLMIQQLLARLRDMNELAAMNSPH